MAITMDHLHIVKRWVTSRIKRIVDHEGPKKPPRYRRIYGIQRTFHFASETEQTISPPNRTSLFVRTDVPCGTQLHAQATSATFFRIDPYEPAVYLSDHESVYEKSLETIKYGGRCVVFRLDVGFARMIRRDLSPEYFSLSDFLGLRMMRGKEIPPL